MGITILATLMIMAAYFLILYGAVGFIQNKRFFSSAPKENLEAIPDKKGEVPRRACHRLDHRGACRFAVYGSRCYRRVGRYKKRFWIFPVLCAVPCNAVLYGGLRYILL